MSHTAPDLRPGHVVLDHEKVKCGEDCATCAVPLMDAGSVVPDVLQQRGSAVDADIVEAGGR